MTQTDQPLGVEADKMHEAIKLLLTNQYEAAFCTLNACIDRCPEAGWNASVAKLAFCQVAFHTLFFSDLYLGPGEESLRRQSFHCDNAQFFRDYEELEDRQQQLHYERPFIKAYLNHCRTKASETVAAETAETLSGQCGFPRWQISRAELHVKNIRHIQHHAAQLSLRLRIDFQRDISWYGSGWREP